MTTSTFYSETADGRIASVSTGYTSARAGTNLGANTTDPGDVSYTSLAGQDLEGAYYHCFEGFYSFDTSSIPDTDTIDSVVFSVYGVLDQSVTDFTINVRLRDWDTTLTTADWVAGASLSGLPLLASFATSGGWSTVGYNDFTSTANFLSNINKTGVTRFMTCSSRHEAGDTPTGNERVYGFWGDKGDPYRPKLVVVHSTATGAAALDPFGMSGFFGQ